MSRIAWYAGRAAAMSPREMVWRLRRMGDVLVHRDGMREQSESGLLTGPVTDWTTLSERFRDGIGRPLLLDQGRAGQVMSEYPGEVAQLVTEADRVLAGERTYFGCRSVNVGTVVDWNHDPITGYRWPRVAANRIDHRVAAGDPKWIWELNRLQHLPLLAQAWLFTGESRYADGAFDHLDSWLDQNPTGIGIAWRGAFEAGIRAISVAIAMQGLRNSPGLTADRYRRVVMMLDASARYCWRARSRFSSANNHLVGELTGLVTVHLLFPELAAPAFRYQRAVEALTSTTEELILPDGAGAEQSISYQLFTAELLAIVAVLLRLRGDQVPAPIVSAIDRSTRYLISVVGSDDPDPRYGDDDDGFALRLSTERKRSVRDHLGIIAASTANATAARYGAMTLTAAWITAALGTPLREAGAAVGSREADTGRYAPNGGLVVLRPGPHRLLMDVGPLGFLSTAAHGHADALAVTLSAGGQELIVDPGTGSYYMTPVWRKAHRGTRAHPTVCVDGADQSVMGGAFYWRRHAVTTVRSVDLDRGIVDAEHDGYRRLNDPVTHRRWLIATPGDTTIVVVDLLDGSSVHDVTVSWPLHPALDQIPTSDGHLVSREGTPVLQLCCAATSPIETGQTRADPDSHLGWWSDRLEARVPAWLLTAHTRSTLPLAMLSVLCTVGAGVIAAPKIGRDGEILDVSWSEHGVRRGLTIDIDDAGAVVCSPCPSDVRLVNES